MTRLPSVSRFVIHAYILLGEANAHDDLFHRPVLKLKRKVEKRNADWHAC